jgi:hypothetical protein
MRNDELRIDIRDVKNGCMLFGFSILLDVTKKVYQKRGKDEIYI